MSIFDEAGSAALLRFISKYADTLDLDKEVAFRLGSNAVRYYGGDKKSRAAVRYLLDLENRWYQSLRNGVPDFTIYGDKYFVMDVWACWAVYSRKYLLSLRSIAAGLGDVKSALDLGCGFGYTTAALKEIFPNAEVAGTNIPGSVQFRIAEKVGAERGFKMFGSPYRSFDLVFASEYFEHFENPIAHLYDILNVANPKYLVIANSFNAISVGHFPKYECDGSLLKGPAASRFFNQRLRECGYRKVGTKFWNSRPTVWEKK